MLDVGEDAGGVVEATPVDRRTGRAGEGGEYVDGPAFTPIPLLTGRRQRGQRQERGRHRRARTVHPNHDVTSPAGSRRNPFHHQHARGAEGVQPASAAARRG